MPDPNAQNRPLSAAFMLLASVFIAASTLCAKALGTEALGAPIHPLQVTFGRFLFAFIYLGTLTLIFRPALGRPNLKLHLLRTSFGWLGVTLMFAAAARIPLGDATAISFLNPVFAMVLAVLFLSEKVGWVRWSAAAVAFLGALILLRPGAGSLQTGALFALMAAAVLGCEIIVIKYLSGREAPFTILLTNNAIGLTIATLTALFVWVWPDPRQWLALAGVGVFMAMAQLCYVNSLSRADASFAVPFSYATLVFAAIYDGVLFATWPDALSLLGAATILAGAALLAWREARLGRA
ncbi:MAG: DMT family transporter [Pseudomonadota bacterium]